MMNAKNKKLDDLTVIDGIGKDRQELFRNKLGIRTYQDLGDLPPVTIVAQLKLDGQNVSLSKVEMWCKAAKALAASDPAPNPAEWNPFVSFVVEFQKRLEDDGSEAWCTAVQPMESEIEKKWAGIETEQLCRWMREWVDERVVKKAPPAPEPVSTPPLPDLVQAIPTIELQQILVYQPPGAVNASAWCTPGQIFTGFVMKDQPFELRVNFSINSCDLGELENSGVNCHLQLFSRHVPGGRILPLADPTLISLHGGQNAYVLALPGVSLPAGTCHIKVLVKLMTDPPVISYQEVLNLMVC